MTFWQFWDAHWFLAFCALVSVAGLLRAALSFVYRLCVRMPMVLLRGWPPAHLDADGDWRPKESPRN